MTAVANPGYHFVSWSDGVTTSSRTDANATANLSVSASFAINTYTLTYAAGSNGTLSGSTPQTVNFGTNGTQVTAIANPGYHFVSWSDGVTTSSRTDANVTANIAVTASFTVTLPPTPIAFVQVAAATPQFSSQTVAIHFASIQTAGNMNVIVVGWNDTISSVQSVKDNVGNVYTLAAGPVSGNGFQQAIYYAKGIKGGATTVTVTFSQKVPYADIRILEYSGVGMLDQTVGASGASSTSSSGSVTTTAANELIFSANTVASYTKKAGSGFTSRIITSQDGNIAQDRIVSSIGTYFDTTSISGSAGWVMQMVSFK